MNEDTDNVNNKTCLECARPLGAGRSDRKFCDEFCRTAYNNSRRKENMLKEPAEDYTSNPAFQKIFSILVDNRNLLAMHDRYVEKPYLFRDLLGKGLNPKYFTSEYHMEGVGLFKFCFDYGYHITKSGQVYIEQRHEEIL